MSTVRWWGERGVCAWQWVLMKPGVTIFPPASTFSSTPPG